MLTPRVADSGFGPPAKKKKMPSSKGEPTKNLYTKSERLTLSCRVTWDWSERVHFYTRQAITLPRKIKTYVTYHHLSTNNDAPYFVY